MRLLLVMLLAAPALSCGRDEASADSIPRPGPARPDPLDFESLATYTFRPGVEIPEHVRKLHGSRIRITGYVYPARQARNIREFILMKDRGTCCYGSKTQWTHFLQVKIPEGKPALNYTTDPVTVTGTFRLDPQVEDDYVLGLYFLDAEEHGK